MTHDINLTDIPLTKDKIVAIFNNLETVTDKTITLTRTRGASSLTDTDKAIATD